MSWRDTVARLLGLAPKIQYKILEVEGPKTPVEWSKEMRDTISTLMAHPGFIALTERLRVLGANLKHKLSNERHSSLEEVMFLQAGIYWSNWLQEQVASATRVTRQMKAYEEASVEDQRALQEFDALIERIE